MLVPRSTLAIRTLETEEYQGPYYTSMMKLFSVMCPGTKSMIVVLVLSQQTFTCSKSTIETLEKGVKYIQS